MYAVADVKVVEVSLTRLDEPAPVVPIRRPYDVAPVAADQVKVTLAPARVVPGVGLIMAETEVSAV